MKSESSFKYDIFLSHSAKNKDVVRDIANRLKSDGVRVWFDEWEIRPGDSIPAKIEDGLEYSRVLVLCLSAEALAADWPQLESHTFRFKDPLNRNRRFIPLRLDDAPTKGSLAQLSYIDWRPEEREREYPKLFEVCSQPAAQSTSSESTANGTSNLESTAAGSLLKKVKLICGTSVNDYAFSPSGNQVVTAGYDSYVQLWKFETGGTSRRIGSHGSIAWSVVWSYRNGRLLTGGNDNFIRVWDLDTGECVMKVGGHTGPVRSLAFSANQELLISGGDDKTVRIWDARDLHCLQVLEGHTSAVLSVDLSADGRRALSVSSDGMVRKWDLSKGLCDGVIEVPAYKIWTLTWNLTQDFAISGSHGGKVGFWDMTTDTFVSVLGTHGTNVTSVQWGDDGCSIISGDESGGICIWDVSEFVKASARPKILPKTKPPVSRSSAIPDQIQYTNAKVLLVGNSAAGKTGLSNRLALGTYKETDSTVGAWATQWNLPLETEDGVKREVWLWDFGGQADQQLIHQLYIDQTQVSALVFDPQKDDVLETLGQWDRDLNRTDKDKNDEQKMTKLLVAGRCDAGGLRVGRKQIDEFADKRGYEIYLETSAKENIGCEELKQAIIDNIKWDNIPWRSSPVLFKRLKDEIIKLKDKDRVLMRFNELRESLALRISQSDAANRFTDAELKAVIGLLSGPGVVWELEFGSWVLLQPERINSYAQAVIQTIREDEFDRGCILEEQVLKGDLTYHASIERLEPDEEQFVLLAMHQILVERGLCIRYMTETGEILLIFPSYYRRERPEPVSAPAVQVSYRFNGFLDEIYATLVVKLHHTKEFDHDQLWRYAADFKTREGRHLGISLTRRADGTGELEVYFSADVPVGEQIIFGKYVHEHLLHSANDVVRLRHYVCPHCGTPVGNQTVAMRKLEEGKKDIPCVECDDPQLRIPLWDELEELFADPATKQHVRALRDEVAIVLDTESKERVLVGEVISTVSLAGQICREVTVSDWGIDAEIEFKNDDGIATAQKIYLQLKSGDSFITTRKRDGVEIFKSFNNRQADYWMNHEFPVILVIRNSKGEIRWMEIRDHLKKVTNNGKKQVRQIEFDGRQFDVMSVWRWRENALGLQRE